MVLYCTVHSKMFFFFHRDTEKRILLFFLNNNLAILFSYSSRRIISYLLPAALSYWNLGKEFPCMNPDYYFVTSFDWRVIIRSPEL